MPSRKSPRGGTPFAVDYCCLPPRCNAASPSKPCCIGLACATTVHRWTSSRQLTRESKPALIRRHRQYLALLKMTALIVVNDCLVLSYDGSYFHCCYIANAFDAICNAPSFVAFPPMKPAACTKTQPGIPDRSDNAWSRIPLHLHTCIESAADCDNEITGIGATHASGSGFRLEKLSDETGTAWILHLPPLSSG